MEKRKITTYDEAVEYLLDIPRFTSQNTMEDTKSFLHRLGNPDKGMKIIHVAGTNGKGSVCAYLRSVLEHAGCTTAVFVSPHLTDIRERFLIKGRLVDKSAFLDVFFRIYEMTDAYHPTFFEYLFFMAMLLFAEADADYCILETGLGGRLDATNAIDNKLLTVITSISLDHVEYLGNTIGQIAGEKAGILREGTPLVFLDSRQEATSVFVEKAAKSACPCYPVSKKDYTFSKMHNKTIDFFLRTQYYGYISLSLHTIAGYQMENAALAVRAVEVLQQDTTLTVTLEQLRQGIAHCIWQGRMEEVRPDVYVDGAHNEDGIRGFLETVQMDGWQGRRTLLFSAVQDKDYRQMMKKLVESELFDVIAVTRLHSNRGVSLECLEELISGYTQCDFREFEDAEAALLELLKQKKPEERIYIAGSLYLAGEIKRYLG